MSFKPFSQQKVASLWETQIRIGKNASKKHSKLEALMPLGLSAAGVTATYFGAQFLIDSLRKGAGAGWGLAASGPEGRTVEVGVYALASVIGLVFTAASLGWVDLRASVPDAPSFALSRTEDGGAGAGKAGEGALPRASGLLEDGEGDIRAVPKGFRATTIKEMLDEAVERHTSGGRNPDFVGQRSVKGVEAVKKGGRWLQKAEQGEYEWTSLSGFRDRAVKMGKAFRALPGVEIGDRIAIYANTSPAWLTAAHACFQEGLVVVTAYASLGTTALAWALEETETKAIVVDKSLLPTLLQVVQGITPDGEDAPILLPKLKHAIVVDDIWAQAAGPRADADAAGKELSDAGVGLIDLEEFLTMGRAHLAGPAPKPDDLAVLMYTSGSTGRPKGVEATHRNIVAGVAGISGQLAGICPDDTYIAYLPLAHILEFVAENCMLVFGARLGYAAPLTLVDSAPGVKPGSKGDATTLQPTVLAGVPAVFNRLRKAVEAKVGGSAILGALFRTAFAWKQGSIERLGVAASKDSVWDPLLFDRVSAAVLGGKVRQMISGGGPLAPETQRWIQTVFSCPLTQGYGLTETMGCATVGYIGDKRLGIVGPPNPSNLIKLVSTDTYDASGSGGKRPQGEICIAGPNIALGYYKMPDKTAEAFERAADGTVWFHTGDVGEWTEDGSIRIIDRIKDLVKLEQGEYVSLGKVEREVCALELVDNACVHADSFQTYTVAIVVPAPAGIKAKLGKDGSVEELAADAEVKQAVLDAIQAKCKAMKMKAFEIPQAVVLAPEPWTPENFLTAALKIRRQAIYAGFKDELAEAYKK